MHIEEPLEQIMTMEKMFEKNPDGSWRYPIPPQSVPESHRHPSSNQSFIVHPTGNNQGEHIEEPLHILTMEDIFPPLRR